LTMLYRSTAAMLIGRNLRPQFVPRPQLGGPECATAGCFVRSAAHSAWSL